VPKSALDDSNGGEVAATSNSSWVKGYSGNPIGEASAGRSLAELLAEIGDERLAYPIDDCEAPAMTRRELLCRVLWTRSVVDGDMTAIKVLLEYLEGKPGGPGAEGVEFTADQMAAAQAQLEAWCAAEACGAGAPAKTEEGSGDGGTV